MDATFLTDEAINERVCQFCGKPLVGRNQVKFCSTKCAAKYRGGNMRVDRAWLAQLSVDELLRRGYDRFCPLCNWVLKPGEPKKCKCKILLASLKRGQIPGVHYRAVSEIRKQNN
jgi:ribosomal protein L37AE/L43A